MSDQTDAIEHFMSMTNTTFEEAKEYITSFGDLESAIDGYFAAQNNGVTSEQEFNSEANSTNLERTHISNIQGERPLGSESSNENFNSSIAASTRSNSNQPKRSANNNNNNNNNSNFMSFSDMVRTNADDEDDEDHPRNTFAGGETSALEVTDPNDSNALIKDLLEKAKRGGERMNNDADAEESLPEHHFEGRGYRLGSVIDAPNAVVEDNTKDSSYNKQQKVKRTITFWKEGFQVGNGELYRYDDPKYSHYLNELNQGRAPLQLLDVEYGQDVDVTVFKKLDESYKAPKRSLMGFQGQGQRLGSPIPGDIETVTSIATTPVAEIEKEVENSEGDTSVQIRYTTGKREVYHCNSTDKVQTLYDYVKSNTVDQSRPFTLNYAFPVKPVDTFDSTIEEADLKNAVVVQRWV